MTADQLQADQLLMADTINFRRMIQANLEAFNDAARQGDARRAGRSLALLYDELGPVRDLDEEFGREWRGIRFGLEVRLLDVARYRLRWRDLHAAKRAFVGLLDRRGMGLRAELPPENDVQEALFLQGVRGELENEAPALADDGGES